jgi:DNA-binding SARP family transcriptional activator
VDVARFESGVREGRVLLDRGRRRRAGTVLRTALNEWRGRPFAGLAEDGILGTEAARLEELRLNALESRIEVDLDVGRAAELIDELEGLLAEHPLRERLWRHLMLALYRGGRQAEGLAAYHRARAALDEQLGIEPSEELRSLEMAILRQDVPESRTGRQAAMGLPASLTSFVGRASELEEVGALLRRALEQLEPCADAADDGPDLLGARHLQAVGAVVVEGRRVQNGVEMIDQLSEWRGHVPSPFLGTQFVCMVRE